MDLKEISWQVAAQCRNLWRLKRSSCHHDVLRLDDAAGGLQDHGAAALCFAQRNDLCIAAHWGANYRRIVLKKTDELVLRSVPVGIWPLVGATRQLQGPVRKLKDERIPSLGAPAFRYISTLQDDVFGSIPRQVVAQRKASMTCANDYRVNHFGHLIDLRLQLLQHWRAKATLAPSGGDRPARGVHHCDVNRLDSDAGRLGAAAVSMSARDRLRLQRSSVWVACAPKRLPVSAVVSAQLVLAHTQVICR